VVHITYTTGTRALPEYTHAPSGLQPSGLCVYFRQSTRACGISITYTLKYTPAVADHIKKTLQIYRRSGLPFLQMVNKYKPTVNPCTARLYLLTKTHKDPMSVRPIVSCINCATENLSKFLDTYLQPIMKELPAYIKDTTQFLPK